MSMYTWDFFPPGKLNFQSHCEISVMLYSVFFMLPVSYLSVSFYLYLSNIDESFFKKIFSSSVKHKYSYLGLKLK